MTKQNDPWVVFDYEVSMFKETLTFGKTQVALPLPQYILNAITESLLLHTRILVDILISKSSDSDDITLGSRRTILNR
jgi:hypothetical protein